MKNCYTKLFAKILDSTIWMEDDKTRLVWITMLAMADQDGIVDAPVPAIADRARVSLEDCRKAIDKFQSPDPDSRTSENEGRRVAKTEQGWLILNHRKYRDMMSLEHRREYNRTKQAEYRAKKNPQPIDIQVPSNGKMVSIGERHVPVGKSLKQVVKEQVEADPITISDRKQLARLRGLPEPEREPTTCEKEYDLDAGDEAP